MIRRGLNEEDLQCPSRAVPLLPFPQIAKGPVSLGSHRMFHLVLTSTQRTSLHRPSFTISLRPLKRLDDIPVPPIFVPSYTIFPSSSFYVCLIRRRVQLIDVERSDESLGQQTALLSTGMRGNEVWICRQGMTAVHVHAMSTALRCENRPPCRVNRVH